MDHKLVASTAVMAALVAIVWGITDREPAETPCNIEDIVRQMVKPEALKLSD